ncbi:uncharacterized protein METZ01_LOCUS499640, partial [marine metagenome]
MKIQILALTILFLIGCASVEDLTGNNP